MLALSIPTLGTRNTKILRQNIIRRMYREVCPQWGGDMEPNNKDTHTYPGIVAIDRQSGMGMMLYCYNCVWVYM